MGRFVMIMRIAWWAELRHQMSKMAQVAKTPAWQVLTGRHKGQGVRKRRRGETPAVRTGLYASCPPISR